MEEGDLGFKAQRGNRVASHKRPGCEGSTYETDIGRFRLPFRLETSPTKSSSSLPASSPLILWPPLSSSGLPRPSSGCVLTLTVEAGGDTPWATLIPGPGEDDMGAGLGDMEGGGDKGGQRGGGEKEEGVRLVTSRRGVVALLIGGRRVGNRIGTRPLETVSHPRSSRSRDLLWLMLSGALLFLFLLLLLVQI